MRIVVVHPEKKRLWRLPAEIVDHAVRRFTGSALCAFVPEVFVVDVETAAEAKAARDREGGDECRSAIPAVLHLLGEQRNLVGEIAAVLVHAVARRIET